MKLTVGVKIVGMNAIAIALIFLIGLVNYYTTNRMVEATDWRQHTYLVKDSLDKLFSSLLNAEVGQRGYLMTKQDNFLEPYRNALPVIDKELSTVKSLTSDNISQQNRIDGLAPLIQSKISNIQESFKVTDPKQQQVLMERGKKTMDDIRVVIKDMNDNENALLTIRAEASDSSVRALFYTITFGTSAAVILLVVLGVMLKRNIAEPLRDITHAANEISVGNLNVSIPMLHRADEIGILSNSFIKMCGALQAYSDVAKQISKGDLTVKISPISEHDVLGNSLKNMVSGLQQYSLEVANAVNVLASTVTEISTSTSQLASSAGEQATAVGETTSTIEQVKQTANVTNAKAKVVADTAQAAVDISKSGKKFTQETNEGMTRIRDQMTTIAESMMRLSEQTQSINTIILTVDDLAQQSNLLAVNASIEAEKAGDNGRGFRIVAQEIKNLADQSKQATSRIREILSDVQKATNTAVLSTEHGNKVVESGVKKSAETGEAIAKLSASVMEATQAAMQISASSSQQLVGVEQVSSAMGSIKTSTQLNLESSKQLETAASNLKQLGEKLQLLIGKYRLA